MTRKARVRGLGFDHKAQLLTVTFALDEDLADLCWAALRERHLLFVSDTDPEETPALEEPLTFEGEQRMGEFLMKRVGP